MLSTTVLGYETAILLKKPIKKPIGCLYPVNFFLTQRKVNVHIAQDILFSNKKFLITFGF